jgi:hypothetical protein
MGSYRILGGNSTLTLEGGERNVTHVRMRSNHSLTCGIALFVEERIPRLYIKIPSSPKYIHVTDFPPAVERGKKYVLCQPTHVPESQIPLQLNKWSARYATRLVRVASCVVGMISARGA